MGKPAKVSKAQLLKLIEELEKNPSDKGRILGDAGITLVGAGLGAAAAGTVAAAVGVTSIPVITGAAALISVSATASTPVGWVIGVAAVGAAAAYGVSRLIRGGGLAEGRKAELLTVYREQARAMEERERTGTITPEDRIRFIVSLRELIQRNEIPPQTAIRLIEQVEQGRISLSGAMHMIQAILEKKEAANAAA